jgi:hypothetical protein
MQGGRQGEEKWTPLPPSSLPAARRSLQNGTLPRHSLESYTVTVEPVCMMVYFPTH